MSIIRKLKQRTILISREQKLRHFFSLFSEGMTVLDVGVSNPVSKGVPVRNEFLKHFLYPGEFYTGLSIQDLSRIKELFPDKKFVQYSGGTFPFKDREFDWIFCNAVIEHVGLEIDQLELLNEMLRVGNNVFFTTPNKFFPIEAHTNALFLHWNNWLFYRFPAKNRGGRSEKPLYLFSLKRLKTLLKNSNVSEFTIYKNRYWGFTMTFTVVCCQYKLRRCFYPQS